MSGFTAFKTHDPAPGYTHRFSSGEQFADFMHAAMGAIISEDIKRTEAHMKRLTRIRDGRDLLVRWEAGELSAPTADDFRMMAESMDWKSQQESDTAKARVAFESAVAWSSARATGVERA